MRPNSTGRRAARRRGCADWTAHWTRCHPAGGVELRPGETLECTCCGGGGYRYPTTRNPECVIEDVAEGWISAARAHSVYRAASDAAGELDAAETAALRSRGR